MVSMMLKTLLMVCLQLHLVDDGAALLLAVLGPRPAPAREVLPPVVQQTQRAETLVLLEHFLHKVSPYLLISEVPDTNICKLDESSTSFFPH